MSEFAKALSMIIAHLTCAGYAALVFAIGFAGAIVVVRCQVMPLIVFPRWVAWKLHKLVFLHPIAMFLIIFCFNALAMCAYMLTGVVHYFVPVLIDFMTATNIGVILFLGASSDPLDAADAPPPELPFRQQMLAALCGLLTALLEIPSFWLAIAMGMTLGGFGLPVANLRAAVLYRLAAYWHIIVPILFLSAAVETLGIKLMAVPTKTKDGEQ